MKTETKSNRNATIVAIICAILGGVATVGAEYIRERFPDKIPKADFVYYSANTNKQMAIAGIETTFINTSVDAAKLKWTFPNGETFSEDTVRWIFAISDHYQVKLEAFSDDGTKTDTKIINCSLYSDYPQNLSRITILFDKNQEGIHKIFPEIRIGTIKGKLDEFSEVKINDAPKGLQQYWLGGTVVYENIETCDINGTGKIEIVPNGRYRLKLVNKSNCQMALVKE